MKNRAVFIVSQRFQVPYVKGNYFICSSRDCEELAIVREENIIEWGRKNGGAVFALNIASNETTASRVSLFQNELDETLSLGDGKNPLENNKLENLPHQSSIYNPEMLLKVEGELWNGTDFPSSIEIYHILPPKE